MPDRHLPLLLDHIAQRFQRPHDRGHARLRERFQAWSRAVECSAFEATWADLLRRVLSRPHWIATLFPDLWRDNPDLEPVIQQLANADLAPAPLAEEVRQALQAWIAEQGDMNNRDGLIVRLLRELTEGDPGRGSAFGFLARYYTWIDLCTACFVDPAVLPLHERVFALLHLQTRNWPNAYCHGYLYQGSERLGLSGIKPSVTRLAGYGIDALLEPDARVLDVGANSGLLALEVARHVRSVDAIELNPFLVEIGRAAAAHTRCNNLRFEVADIVSWQAPHRYDAIFSLANHCTIDGRMSMNFEAYLAKLFGLLEPGGWLFFESHNVFAPGTGAPGDDGDLEVKLHVAERYFEVLATRMTRAFVPAHDIDKLFVLMRRRPAYAANAIGSFRLAHARQVYGSGPLIAAGTARASAAALPAPRSSLCA